MAGRGNKVGDGNRMRNTQQNKLSKNTGGAKALPAMSPAQNAAYYSQMQALFSQYQNQLMQLKQERVGLRTGFRQARTDIRGELIGGLSDVQNSNIERGTYGGSAGYQQEIGVRAEADQARAAAKTEMLQGLAYNKIAKQGAAIDYQMGLAQLQAEKLAQQQEQLAAQLERNAIISGFERMADSMSDSNKGDGGGGGRGANTYGAGNNETHAVGNKPIVQRADAIMHMYKKLVGAPPMGPYTPALLRQMLESIKAAKSSLGGGGRGFVQQ